MRKKVITSEVVSSQIDDFLKKGKAIKKLPTRLAIGASVDGSVCAASFGASALGRQQSRAKWRKEFKERKKARKNSKRKRPQASMAQRKYLYSLGATNLPKDLGVKKASYLITKMIEENKKIEMINEEFNKAMNDAMNKEA